MNSSKSPTTDFEKQLLAEKRFLLAVDEVGRGAIAGPVAVGVVLIDKQSANLDAFPPKVRDSKLLSAKVRSELIEPLTNWVTHQAVGFSSAEEIDTSGIVVALARAAGRAIDEILTPELRGAFVADGVTILLDGSHNWLAEQAAGLPVVVRTKADRDCASVAAASVFAKVSRDSLMQQLAIDYPEFGLDGHKGYASAAHIEAIHTHGPSAIHRHTWLTKILADNAVIEEG